ncbi:hypothetical protein OQY15_05785 [Pedobacter sp. MC2016-15]|uniref:hypothetical protein n=1 Tax=Pedobacter sp. MC2016-15 TaxID=2994473 RepID=UPI0022469373|nr:hypothetical protein [Pedobacter sp. MC2016-15]MCX2478592.1 hypothetical protein [Pedobacter sp. MC2016-15]
MKKLSFYILALLVATFVIGQSFNYKVSPEKTSRTTTSFRSFPLGVSMCGTSVYLDKDSALNIPALKGWGHYKWEISSVSDSARYYFNQGISLYYAFHNLEAIASFSKATKLDPDCAMAWYGKALAMGPTINYDQDYLAPSAALEAANKSQELSAGCNALEKDLIEAIQHRYSADTSMNVKQLRINYAAAMEKVYEKHKNDADAITLYADAELLLHPWDMYNHDFSPKPWTPKIQSLLEQAMKLSPEHPGANHFYIHTMEGSAHPETAIKSAHLLDTLMPQVAHITHMPSHIYIRTGDYSRGIKVNDDAAAGYSLYKKEFAPVTNSEFLYETHTLHLKSSCAQMAGNYETAMDAAVKVSREAADSGAPALKTALGNYMQYVYSAPLLTNVRFGKWDEIISTSKPESLLFADILQHFAKGMAYSRKHQTIMAKNELKAVREKMSARILKEDAVTYSTAYDICRVADLILAGVIDEDQKDYTGAIGKFQQAVIAEDHLIYSEPRAWTLPARQFLGEVYIKARQHGKAINIFNQDLQINPDNGWSLTGLSIAYQSLHNIQALAQTKIRLKTAWKISDTEINSAVF